jgi:hypothetical protein
MKRTESTDEAVQSNDQVLASGYGTGADETSTMDQRRRRLVRGAAALAPLVLTLRSGALAAASCTGAKAIETIVGDDGKPIIGTNPDWCIPIDYAPVCKEHPDKLENVPGAGDVGVQINRNTGKCGSGANTLPPGTRVAILSSDAYTSFRA